MDHYVEFRLLPDPEFQASVLMNVLFAKLHRALVALESRELAVSFPRFRKEPPSPGDCLRVHGSAENLQCLMATNWLTGMRDHLQVKPMELVPAHTLLHCRVRRVQPKSNVERLRRRYMRRHNVTDEEVARRIPDTAEQRVHLPFVQIKSQSTGQHFCLFLEHLAPQEQAISGVFNSYGLSRTATVPWF